MSLDVYLQKREVVDKYRDNITHNLGEMASAAGLYEPLWHPEKLGITRASQLIKPLTRGLTLLHGDPPKYRELNQPNGWGTYEGLVRFVTEYLAACKRHPDAEVVVSR